jgi:hypothetical protein
VYETENSISTWNWECIDSSQKKYQEVLTLLPFGSDCGYRRENSAISYEHLNFDLIMDVTLIKNKVSQY